MVGALSGYGVAGLPFRSGHVLAMRRFTGSSPGPIRATSRLAAAWPTTAVVRMTGPGEIWQGHRGSSTRA